MEKLKIVVAGLIGSFPMAGSTLSWLQYFLGLRELGHEVLYLEDTGKWYYDPQTTQIVSKHSIPLNHIKTIMDSFGLSDSWTFINHKGEAFGVTGTKFQDFLKTADLLVHVTGAMWLKDEYLGIPRRAYVDTDPGFIQLRIANGSQGDLEHLQRHTVHFSFGCNIGSSDCLISTAGFNWHPTVQPICLKLWSVASKPLADAPFSTIVKWDAKGHGPIEYGEEVFGVKDLEFLKFRHLPEIVNQPLELAMAGSPPVDSLEVLGWRSRSGPEVSATIESYRNYIHNSRGEWSIAKNGYVKTRGGWFSDRSAAYLASGRPVVVQSTGFESWLPTGKGVLPFSTLEEAKLAIELVNNYYPEHCQAAREIAEEFFNSDKVLRHLVDTAMSS